MLKLLIKILTIIALFLQIVKQIKDYRVASTVVIDQKIISNDPYKGSCFYYIIKIRENVKSNLFL